MKTSSFPNVKITSILAGLPKTKNSIETMRIPEAEIPRLQEIALKLGVLESRVINESAELVDLGIDLICKTLEINRLDISEITHVFCITQTSDFLIPGYSSFIQSKLPFAEGTRFMDISQGCAGFVDGLQLAAELMTSADRKALLITAEAMSKTLDPLDYGNRALFGDATTVTLLEYAENSRPLEGFMRYDGSGYRGAYLKADNFQTGEPNFFTLNGPAVFGLAVRAFEDTQVFLKGLGRDLQTFPLIVPHQANTFILQKIAQMSKIPIENIIIEMDKTGNTSSNSIPLALCIFKKKTINLPRSETLFLGFGNGFSWGAIIVDLMDTHLELVDKSAS
jgi:3-oxoacyl-[acyl-carrier-protein] synthase-3